MFQSWNAQKIYLISSYKKMYIIIFLSLYI